MSDLLGWVSSRIPWKWKLYVNHRLSSMQYVLLRYTSEERAQVLPVIQQIRREVELLLDDSESCQIFNAVRHTAKVEGDLAEVGVFRGGSAKLICQAKGARPLHLFDTFEGLPEPENGDAQRFHAGQFVGLFEDVQRYLKTFPQVFLYKGYFPDSAGPIEGKRFSFVHLDVDLYKSTLGCLEYFYPRMSRGGIIISHDYNNAEGVRRAFDVFFADKPEPVLEVALSQALVVKV
jgi:hypothetical protein